MERLIKMFRIDELIVYREYEQEQDQVLNDMAFIVEETETMGMPVSDLRGLYFSCIHKLTELAGTYGFEGNLWHSYLTWLLVNNENVFSHASEIRGEVDGSINALVEHDYEIFRELYALNFEALEEKLGAHCFFMIADYVNAPQSSKVFNERIRDRICELSEKLAGAKDVHEFKEDMTSFYKDFGVGKLGLHKAFRVAHDEDGVQIVPITKIAHVHLDDLVGYELAKKNGIEVIDASCPVVLNLQKKIRKAYEEVRGNGGQIVIYGKRGHAEVNGLVAQTNDEALIIEQEEDLKSIDFSRSIILFSQTTKSLDGFKRVVELVKESARASVVVNDTICRKVANRIPQLKDFAARHDVILFVSGEKSSNGKQLFEVCREVNPRTYFVQGVKDLRDEMFDKAGSVGISGATSTPRWVMEEIKEELEAKS